MLFYCKRPKMVEEYRVQTQVPKKRRVVVEEEERTEPLADPNMNNPSQRKNGHRSKKDQSWWQNAKGSSNVEPSQGNVAEDSLFFEQPPAYKKSADGEE